MSSTIWVTAEADSNNNEIKHSKWLLISATFSHCVMTTSSCTLNYCLNKLHFITQQCMESITLRPFYSPGPSGYKFHIQLGLRFSYSSHLIGWRSNIGGYISASFTAVMPAAHMSHYGLPWHQHDTSTVVMTTGNSQLTSPNLAATSGAILFNNEWG